MEGIPWLPVKEHMKTLIILVHLLPTILLIYPVVQTEPVKVGTETIQAVEKPLVVETVKAVEDESIEQYAERRSNEIFGEGQFESLNTLIHKESGYRADAQNPHSTAFGIGQFLNSTWAGTGIEKTDDPELQIDAMLIYIQNRYGDPSEALRFHLANNSY